MYWWTHSFWSPGAVILTNWNLKVPSFLFCHMVSQCQRKLVSFRHIQHFFFHLLSSFLMPTSSWSLRLHNWEALYPFISLSPYIRLVIKVCELSTYHFLCSHFLFLPLFPTIPIHSHIHRSSNRTRSSFGCLACLLFEGSFLWRRRNLLRKKNILSEWDKTS